MKTLIYTRVSHKEQEKEGLSLEYQLERCLAYCDYRGMEVGEVITDGGVSGFKTDKRAGWVRIMELVKSGRIDSVVVYSLSRLGRNTEAILGMIRLMREQGVKFHSITENLDSDSATGKFFIAMIAANDQFFRDLTSERIKGVLDMKRSKGEALGSIAYGFQREGKMLVENEYEMGAVAIVIELREQGKSMAAISAELERLDYKPRTGDKFHPQTISNILTNNKKGIYKLTV